MACSSQERGAVHEKLRPTLGALRAQAGGGGGTEPVPVNQQLAHLREEAQKCRSQQP